MIAEASRGERLDPHGDRPWARRLLIVALVALSVAAIGNIAIEARSAPDSRAVIVHDGGELAEATSTEPSLSRGRYWIASIVHDVAFGGVVVVPDRSVINPYRFENLASVEVSVDSYDPELTPETVAYLDSLPTAQGLGNVTGLFDFALFRVVWDPQATPVPVLRLWYFGDMMYFVDDRVLSTRSHP